MENFDYTYDLYKNAKPTDFLIKPKNLSDSDFEGFRKIINDFSLSEIKVFNFLFEELFLRSTEKTFVSMSDVIRKLGVFPDILSSNLKSLIKRNYIKLFSIKYSQPIEIAVKFTDNGLSKIKLMRQLFLWDKL
jgi:DNA-binding MarR family transcriptional regulator